MLHRLLYHHPILTKLNFGVVHICANRITGKIKCMVFYPEGYDHRIDITNVDHEVFFAFKDVVEALNYIEETA